jgi:hypothetical protein
VETTVKAFGIVVGLAGLEHGVGELLQGNVAPAGVVIKSWPDSPFFSSLDGEPAMTLVPNLLVTGILAILASLALLAWVMRYVDGRYGAVGLIGLSGVLLLVGGGFGPPLLGVILGATAIGIRSPLSFWRRLLPGGLLAALGTLWPWALGVGLVAWLVVSPGVGLLGYWGVDDEALTMGIIAAAFLGLVLAIVSSLARDAQTRDAASGALHG